MKIYSEYQQTNSNPDKVIKSRSFLVMYELISLVIICQDRGFCQTHFLNDTTQVFEQELEDLLDKISLAIQRQLQIMYDGASSHFSLVSRQFPDEVYNNNYRLSKLMIWFRWIDCNPLDCVFWIYLQYDSIYLLPKVLLLMLFVIV